MSKAPPTSMVTRSEKRRCWQDVSGGMIRQPSLLPKPIGVPRSAAMMALRLSLASGTDTSTDAATLGASAKAVVDVTDPTSTSVETSPV